MKLVCPVCCSVFPLESALNDKAAREAVVSAFSLTDFGSLMLAYVQLFKPESKALSMQRFAKLLNELVDMIKTGQIVRNGRAWAAPKPYWRQAFESMVRNESLNLPLKSHGYLFEIIVGYANKAEAGKEKQAEQGRIYGRTEDSPVPPAPVVEATTQSPKPKRKNNVIPDDVSRSLRNREWQKK